MRTVPTSNKNLSSTLRLAAVCLVVSLLSACAHPIQIRPELNNVDTKASRQEKINAKVGYYISPTDMALEVTTPGGGGDDVRYHPYQDLETGLQKVLSNVFREVVKLSGISNNVASDGQKVSYTIMPAIVTTSGSSNIFTWPPTNFTVDIATSIRNDKGELVASPRAVGSGYADTSDRITDHGIAGKRAAEESLVKLQQALFDMRPVITGVKSATVSPGSVEDRLKQVSELRDKGAISEAEFQAKRKAILETM